MFGLMCPSGTAAFTSKSPGDLALLEKKREILHLQGELAAAYDLSESRCREIHRLAEIIGTQNRELRELRDEVAYLGGVFAQYVETPTMPTTHREGPTGPGPDEPDARPRDGGSIIDPIG